MKSVKQIGHIYNRRIINENVNPYKLPLSGVAKAMMTATKNNAKNTNRATPTARFCEHTAILSCSYSTRLFEFVDSPAKFCMKNVVEH